MTSPMIHTEDLGDYDVLDSPEAHELHARDLRPGMVLLDELGTPACWLLHKGTTPARSGSVLFTAEDLDDGSTIEVRIHANRLVNVIAA